jgi:prepilin-type N-terminal cleavage/methylation domain-containing protein
VRRFRFGFTLLELIVVVVIASVLAAIAIPSFDPLRDRSSTETLERTADAVDREVRGLLGFSDGLQSDVDDSIVTALDELPETLSVVRDGNQIDFINGDICVRLVVSGTSELGTVSSCNTVAPASTPSASPTPTPTPTPTPLALSYLDQSFDASTASESLLPTVTNGTAVSFSLAGTLPANVSFNTTSGSFTGPAGWSGGATGNRRWFDLCMRDHLGRCRQVLGLEYDFQPRRRHHHYTHDAGHAEWSVR